MDNFDDIDFDISFRRDSLSIKTEKRELFKLSVLAGAALCLYVILQNMTVLLLEIIGLYNFYLSDYLFQNAVGLLISVVSILLPFLAFTGKQKKIQPDTELFPAGKPQEPILVVLAIPVGLALCIIGSYASSYLQAIIESVGFTLSSPDLTIPKDSFGTVIYFFRVTVVAAIVEEMVMRGIVLQSLRKYGSWFAIFMSSMVFGLMHCNLVQAPFAFFAGFALGYFAIATESLWTPILIHFANNLFSTLMSLAVNSLDDTAALALYNLTIIFIFVSAIICSLLFLIRRKTYALPRIPQILKKRERLAAYIFSPTMILAIICMLYVTSNFVKWGH